MEEKRRGEEKLNAENKVSSNPPVYGRAEYLLAILLLCAAWFYVNGPRELGPLLHFECGLAIFTALFLLAGSLYLSMTGRKMSREAKLYMMLTLLAAAWFLLEYLPGNEGWVSQDIALYLFFFLHVTGVYWVLTISGNRIDGCLNENGSRDIGRGLFLLPFANFVRLFALVRKLVLECAGRWGIRGKKRVKSRKAVQVYIGLLASIPVLIIVLPMLVKADDSFRAFAGDFAVWCTLAAEEFLSMFSFSEILRNMLVFCVGCYLFGLFYGAFYTKPPRRRERTELPPAMLLTFSAVICGVYLLFFLVKLTDAAGILLSVRPDVVYSSFAREGFFELCAIAVINFCLFYGVKVFANPRNQWLKRGLSVLGAETLGFIVLAFSKMSLYISVYGFTFKRVFTSWFMCVLFVTFSLLIKALWRKSNAIRPAVLFTAVTFLLLAYSNIDYWIGRVNILMGVL